MRLHSNSNIRGGLIIELVVACAIFSLLITSTSLVISGLYAYSKHTVFRRQQFFEQKTALDAYLYSGSSSPHLAFHQATPCKRYVSTQAEDKLTVLEIDIPYLINLGGDCGGNESEQDPSIKHISSPYPISTIDTFHGLVVVGLQSSSSSDPDLAIYDMKDSLILLSERSLSNAGLNDLDVANDHIYAAAIGTSSQLRIIDVHDPRNPQTIASRSLPGVSGSYPSGLSIFYYDKKVYVGTHRTAGREFHIYDVQIPSEPQWLGSIELNHNINAITVRPPYAYLATSGNAQDVIILNIRDPTRITQETSVSILGDEDALSVFLSNTSLFVGRTRSKRAGEPNVIELSIEDLSKIYIKHSTESREDIRSVLVINSKPFSYTYPIDYENGIIYAQ